MKVAMKPK